ncbi:MAG: oligosaccharide flippase family protein [Desulfuromonadales bacterium]|nr:oligosaccharide flippase family protein [Desulfuromonadales bacterium]
MSLKRNIIASYASQIYVTLIGIAILPLYIKYMGAEAYGLVGFFAMLQAWFNLLDLGLTPTIGRETARFRAGVGDALGFRQLFRALNSIFLLIALIGGGGLFLFSGYIAEDWLKAQDLPLAEIQFAVQIMALSVALRWVCGLYRGVITGSEKLVWLSVFNAVIATFRFVLVLPVMWHFGATPTVFFVFQLLVAILQITVLFVKTRCLLPVLNAHHRIGWSFAPVKPLLKFALTIAFTSSVWVMVTQTDKLVLSGILPLEEYGYFTLAVLVASGIMVIGGPISGAIMPRMAMLEAEGNSAEVIRIYRQATQFVVIIAGSAAVTLVFCAEPLLFAWTGDAALVKQSAPILLLYSLGNGALAVAAFPYYLQYAKGDMRYHLIGNAVLAVILIPSIVYVATYYGAVGAGYVWLISNTLLLLFWVAYVHHKIVPGLHWQWLSNDILKILLPAVIAAYVLSRFNIRAEGRVHSLLYVALLGGVTIGIAMLSSKDARRWLLSKIT